MSKKITISLIGVLMLLVLLNLTGFERNAEAADIPVHDPKETADDDIGSGEWGTCPWRITSDGVLTIGAGTGADITSSSGSPWYSKRANILQVRAENGVVLPEISTYLFCGCSNCTDMDLYGFNTKNVTDMSYMFTGCSRLTSLDVSSLNTENVKNMSCMFQSCSNLTSLNIANMNTENVTTMSRMFSGCNKLTSLDVSILNTGNVTDMSYMFSACSSLTSLDLSSLNTENVTNMAYMFNYCYGLTSLNLTNLSTKNVINMSYMFYTCSKLESLNVSSFNTENVTSMDSMFYSCSKLTSLDLSSFDTSQVTSMGSMFYGCYALTSLDLSSFNTVKIARISAYSNCFSSCSKLKRVRISSDIFNSTLSPVILIPYFETWYAEDDNSTGFTANELKDNNIEGWVTADSNIFSSSPALWGTCPWWITSDGTLWIGSGKGANITRQSDCPWYSKHSSILKVKTEKGVVLPATSSYLFPLCSNVTEMDLSGFDTSNVTTMKDMFNETSSLTSLDLSNFNTSKVTDMSWMFHSCRALTSLDISSFNTSNVTTMYHMFYGCSTLETLDLSSFNTTKVTDMSYMFQNCNLLTTLNIASFNTSKVTDMSNMFENCSSIKTLDLSNFNTANVTAMNSMFRYCSSLTSLNITSFNTKNVTTISSMYSRCSSLAELDLSNFNTVKVTSYESCFYDCSNLKRIRVSKSLFNSSSHPVYLIPYFDSWYKEGDSSVSYSAKQLKESNITGWIVTDNEIFLTSPVLWGTCPWWITSEGTLWIGSGTGSDRTFSYYCPWYDKRNSILAVKTEEDVILPASSMGLFCACSKITKMDLSGLITNNVTNMSTMFYGCSSLKEVDLSGFDTSQVTTMSEMFEKCSTLKTLDLSVFDTSQVKSMAYMFSYCSGLTSLDLSSFDTSNTTNMYEMFYKCSSLTTLDLSNFDTGNVTSAYNMTLMLGDCSSLTRINLGSNYFNSSVVYANCRYLPQTTTTKWISEDGLYGPYEPSELQKAWQSTDEDGNYAGNAMAGWYVVYVETYTLEFNANSGTGQMTSQLATVGKTETITPNQFYKFNHVFTSWNTEPDGTGTKYTDEQSIYNIGSDGEVITLYAQWTKKDTKFNLEDDHFQIEIPANVEAVITGLPGGSTYAVSEQTSSGWIIQQSDNTTGSINPNESSVVSFINLETDDSLSVTFSASKLLDGKAPDGQEFSFTLTEVTDPENPVEIETVANSGSSIIFSPVTFTHLLTNDDVETRTFEIREVAGSDSTINYDDHVYTVTVKTTVEDDKIVLYGYEEDGSSTFENTTKPGSLMINKTVEGTDATDKKFTFEVLLSSSSGEALDGKYGDVDVKDGKAEITLKANESVTLTDLPAGTVYRVTETNIPNGYICLDTDRTGTIKATEESTESFVNVYSAEGSVEIEAQKIYTGGSLTAGLFGFELYDTNGNLIASTTNNANGTIFFDAINYVTPGTYSYLLKEKVGSVENVNYDLTEKPVTVTVTDNGDGTMSADIEEDTPTFTNSKQTGSLVFTKMVRNATEAAINKAVFNFDITIENSDGEEITDDFDCTIGEKEMTISSGDSFDLIIGETLTVPVLPDGAVVTITETTPEGFEFQDEESTLITTIKANEEAETEAVYEYASEVEVNITAQKLLIGASLADYQFDFGIYDEDGLLISNGTTDADGNITFEPLYYNSEDDGQTYRVSIIEKQGYSGIEYADSKEFTVSLQDNGDGTMTATTDWVGGNSVFINKIATGKLPSAGNLNRQHVVLSLMLVAFLFEAAYVLSKRKRK